MSFIIIIFSSLEWAIGAALELVAAIPCLATKQHAPSQPGSSLSPRPGESERPVMFESGRGSVSEELDLLRTVIDQRRADGGEGGARGKASRRRKRFLSYPRYVELMVTADAKMTRHHGRNLEHYILTIMSVVSKILSSTFSLTHSDLTVFGF